MADDARRRDALRDLTRESESMGLYDLEPLDEADLVALIKDVRRSSHDLLAGSVGTYGGGDPELADDIARAMYPDAEG